MYYCKVVNEEIVLGPRQLPDDISPETAEQENWFPVIFLNMPHQVEPQCNKITQLIEMQMQFDGTQVKVTHIVVNKFANQIDATRQLLLYSIRDERDKKLLLTDWTQLPNAYGLTDSKKVEWENYRQQLRDFPNTVNLENIIWPIPPV